MSFYPTEDENGRQGDYELKLYRYEASLTSKPAKCRYNGCPHADRKIKGKELKLCFLKTSPTFHGKHQYWYHVDCFFQVCKPHRLSDLAMTSSLSIENQHFIQSKIEGNPYSTCRVAKTKRKPSCQICDKPIKNNFNSQGDLSVQVNIDRSIYALHYGPVLWQFHPNCFNRAKHALGFENQLTENMQGYNELSNIEKNTLLQQIPNSQLTQNGSGVTATATNGHTQDDLELLATLEHWRSIFKKMKSPDKNELAKQNNQREKGFMKHVPQAEVDLIDRLADCATFGALDPCFKCKGGALLFYNDRYICTGIPRIRGKLCPYTDCPWEYTQPPRKLFFIPQGIAQKYPDLQITNGYTLSVPRVRPISTDAPVSDLSDNLSEFLIGADSEPDIEIQDKIQELLTREPMKNSQRLHVQNGCVVDPGFQFVRERPRLQLTPNCVHVYRPDPEANHELFPPPKSYSAYLAKISSRRDLNILCKLQLLIPHRHLLEQIYFVSQSYGPLCSRDTDTATTSSNHTVIGYRDLTQAKLSFKNIYYDLTGNLWTSGRFEKLPNKYFRVGTNFNGHGINNLNWSTTIRDPEIQTLLQNIFDQNLIRNFLITYDLDISALPLGILDPKELHQAKFLLNQLSQLLNNYERGTDMEVAQLSTKFHSIVPHDLKNGTRQVPLLNAMDKLQRMYELLEYLQSVGYNYNLTVRSNNNQLDMDCTYAQLNCRIEHLPTTGQAHDFVRAYVESSWVTQAQGSTLGSSKYVPHVINTFTVATNAGDISSRSESESIWLMHGTKPFCIPGILKYGLKSGALTPEISTGGDGQFFGTGIYFSEISTKCADYCSFQENQHIAYLLVCEISPQNIVTVRESVEEDPDHYRKLGHDFVHCLGGLVKPGGEKYLNRRDGTRIKIPLGPLVINPSMNNTPYHQFKEGIYVLYDDTRVVIRYIVQLKLDKI